MGAAGAGWHVIGLLEVEGGQRSIGFLGPAAAARVAQSCQVMAFVMTPESVRQVCLSLGAAASAPGQEQNAGGGGGLWFLPSADTLVAGVPLPFRPELRILRALLRIARSTSSGSGSGTAASAPRALASLDEIYALVAQGVDPGPAALWARALGRQGLARLLERAPVTLLLEGAAGRGSTALDVGEEVTVEDFFKATLDANVAGVVRCLAAGMPLQTAGPPVLGTDPGCCRWSALAAAAHASSYRSQAPAVVALLLAARADADAPCAGPCGWTPLMHAARAGGSAAEACRLLVLAGADIRRRHAGTGETALDMGDSATSRAIREARDQRAAAAAFYAAASIEAAKSGSAKVKVGRQGDSRRADGSGDTCRSLRAVPPLARLALASAGGRSSKGTGKRR